VKDLNAINERRKKCLLLFFLGIVAIIVGVLILYIFGTPFGIVFGIAGFISFIAGAVTYDKLRKDFKNKFIRSLIEEMFEEARYFPNKGVSPDNVYRCNFIKKADRFHSEDLILGKVGDVRFHTADLKLQERRVRHTKNGTQVYYVTYFLGRFFEFDFPKEFKGQVIVSEKGLFTFWTGLKKIELESVEFNKKFNTYTTDEHNAFYILTPHFMQSLIELEKRHPGSISISFTGNTFNLAINNSKNSFELNLFKRLNDEIVTEFKRDLAVIVDIVNELKLNRNIFKY
jgi:hypothetical protein